MASFESQQKQIDALLQVTEVDPIPVQKRLLTLSQLGVEDPKALTDTEVQQVCYALIVHFHQMDIK